MNYFILFLSLIISMEILYRAKFRFCLQNLLIHSRKSIAILSNSKVSDNWKEKLILYYSCKIMKLSLKLFFSILSCLLVFIVFDIFINDFLIFSLSLFGVFESIMVILAYIYFRNLFKNE